nr:hypothetical protein [Tanacetum cinerariifolium]
MDANKDPQENKIDKDSKILVAKKLKELLNKEKRTKVDLIRADFEVLKSRYRNNLELKYHMEQNHLAMENKIDWTNPEGNTDPTKSFHTDLTKPLPLEGLPRRRTMPSRYFFNRDFGYLMHKNKEKKYSSLLTKYYNAIYEQEGIKEIIPHVWTYGFEKYDRDAASGIHHWNEHCQWFYKVDIGCRC